jgi:MFS family permease
MTTTSPETGRVALPRQYLVWLGGATASQLGDAVLYFAFGWAASGHGPTAAGLVLSAIALPRTVLLLLGGAVGDRWGARQVMIVGDTVMLAVAVVLAVVSGVLGAPLALLIVSALVIGTNDAFYLPSAGSMPRRLVADTQLSRAVALRQSGSQLVSLVGPPLGGVLVAFAGLPAASWVDAATFAVVLVVLVAIRPAFAPPEPKQRKQILREAAEGVRIAFTTAGLKPALLLVAGAAGFVLPFVSILIPLLSRSNDWGPTGAGILVGVQSAGTIAATLAIGKAGTLPRPGVIAAGALAVTGAGQVVVALTPDIPLACIGAALVGLGTGVFVGHLGPVVLSAAPTTHLARVQAILSLVQSTTLLVTNNVLGGIARGFGAVTAMLVCAGVLLACAVIGMTSPGIRKIT